MDAVWDGRSDGRMDEAAILGLGIGQWKGVILGANLRRTIVTNGTLRRTCAKVREPSELPFAVVRGVGRGIAVLDGVRSTSCKGKGRFCGLLFPDLYYKISHCVAASVLLGLFLRTARRLGHAFRLQLGEPGS